MPTGAVSATIALMAAGALLAYVASAILIAWGSAHLAPTRTVAASFGEISADNRRILVMEWAAVCPFVLTGSAALLVLASVV
jgi:hypothetical protein